MTEQQPTGEYSLRNEALIRFDAAIDDSIRVGASLGLRLEDVAGVLENKAAHIKSKLEEDNNKEK